MYPKAGELWEGQKLQALEIHISLTFPCYFQLATSKSFEMRKISAFFSSLLRLLRPLQALHQP